MSAEALTYDSLISDIQLYCERYDEPFLSQRARFVMMAENRIASECRGLGLQKYVTGSMNSNEFEKPTRWRETISFNVTVGTERVFLFERSYDYCRSYAPDAAVTGAPRFYADYDYEHFFIAPTPDATYDFELAYYERPEPLSDTNQTNWTTRYYPQLLLYACLLETAPFLKNDQRIAGWQALYDRAKQGLEQESNRRTIDRAAVRSGE